MTEVQWLLIGGDSHGKTLWVKGGDTVICRSVVYPAKTGLELQQYDYCDYLHDWKMFRIGLHNPTPEQRAEIPRLIDEKRLTAMHEVSFRCE